jgi:CubicO group peptidase (beta-lactamase class C family)
MEAYHEIDSFLQEGVDSGVFPGGVFLGASKGRIVCLQAVGHRLHSDLPSFVKPDTIYDLASLTKPLATTLAMMKLVSEGKLSLDQSIKTLLPVSVPEEKQTITPRFLLCHAAGFVAWEPFYLQLDTCRQHERKACLRDRLMEMPLNCDPGHRVVYSDLGFLVLEWIIEEISGMPLSGYVQENFFQRLGLQRTFFSTTTCPTRFKEDEFAATETCSWRKKTILGCVHDENAYALGGYAGHAGLFGTANDVYLITNLLREHFYAMRSDCLNPETVRRFFTRQDFLRENTWALGWDTPSPQNSSAGRFFSPHSVGHLGFTGTSVWIDLEKDVVAIFLTNRVHPTRENDQIRSFRPRLHDAFMKAAGAGVD